MNTFKVKHRSVILHRRFNGWFFRNMEEVLIGLAVVSFGAYLSLMIELFLRTK